MMKHDRGLNGLYYGGFRICIAYGINNELRTSFYQCDRGGVKYDLFMYYFRSRSHYWLVDWPSLRWDKVPRIFSSTIRWPYILFCWGHTALCHFLRLFNWTDRGVFPVRYSRCVVFLFFVPPRTCLVHLNRLTPIGMMLFACACNIAT